MIEEAIKILKKQMHVNPTSYMPYRNGYIFVTDENNISPLYIVDMDKKTSGPFSVALDIDGFLKHLKTFKKLIKDGVI